MQEEVKNLISWIAEHIEAEPLSGFLPYGPRWNVEAVILLEAIGAFFNLTPEEVGEVFNPVRERIEA